MSLSNFVELKLIRSGRFVPDFQVARQQIKVGFRVARHHENPLKTVYGMVLYIGIEICQQLQLQAGDKIKFFIEEKNPRTWQIKKALDDCGYTLINSSQSKSLNHRYLKCQITWRFFNPTPEEIPLHRVSHEVLEDGLLIKLV
jgi:hypothetical protein